MPAIPEKLFRRLHKTLLDCKPFASHEELVHFFEKNKHLQWVEVPLSKGKVQRVLDVISWLQEEPPNNKGEALLTFLQTLSSTCCAELADLINELTPILAPKSEGEHVAILASSINESGAGVRNRTFMLTQGMLARIGRAVGEVSVPRIVTGISTDQVGTGTGWLIAIDLALTCYHVIKNRNNNDDEIGEADLNEQIQESILIFGYEAATKGIDYRVSRMESGDPDLDYALLRIENTRTDKPLTKWGIVPVEKQAPLTKQTQLVIIQHPEDNPQESSDGFYYGEKSGQGKRIFHTVQTNYGTSGAPVLNARNLKAVALHTGKVSDRGEATRIRAILDDIKEKQPDLYEEIKQSQPEGGL